jgi:hypothetical protein
MQNRHLRKARLRVPAALLAAMVTGAMAVPAYAAPADNDTPFRGAAAQTGGQQASALADDSILVLLSSNADRNKVSGYLQNESQSNVVHDAHVESENYSVLQVQPPKGQHVATLNKINQMRGKHSEILSVSENFVVHRLSAPLDTVPNDPDFATQWPLANLRYTAARNKYNVSFTQTHAPYITVLADGVDPVSTNSELGAYVTQYNATGTNVVQETVHGTFNSGGGEGDVDTSITSCLSDNGTLMTGYASFASNNPCYITMLRMTSNGSVSTATIVNAITWCLNHQSLRGGKGPINLSYGTSYPQAPLWSNSMIQSLAKSLQKQGDLLVVSSGDTRGTYSAARYAPGSVIVVQGTDQNNKFYSNYLTLVANDPVAAPGAVQPAVLGGQYMDDYYGTSFSAPLWCASIAMCLSVNPALTSLQAHQIVVATGTKVVGSKWAAVVPALDLAIARAATTK